MRELKDPGDRSKLRLRGLMSMSFACVGLFALCAAIYVAIKPLPSHARRASPIPFEPTLPSAAPSQVFTVVRSPVTRTAVATASADDADTQRIQAYLDSLYTKTDVVSSFRSKAGEDIDCINFYAQPSVKIEMARGHQIRMPSSVLRASVLPPSALPPSSADSMAFDAQPDESGHPRKCFGMTVPVLRTSVARIKASGGLRAYLRRSRQPVVPPQQPPSGPPADSAGFMHIIGTYGVHGTGGFDGQPVLGGSATASIWQPGPSTSGALAGGGHSLGQTWTTSLGGPFCNDSGGSNCVQTVEFGWMVSPQSCADDECVGRYLQCADENGTEVCTPDARPHLFAFSTQDGYISTGCYDAEACAPFACGPMGFNEPCSDFPPNDLVPNPLILFPGAPYAIGQALTPHSC
jgi:hypothetical protein